MSTITGGCHCGAIRYEVQGDAMVHALCHCRDCRLHAGAPVVGWTMYAEGAVKVTKGEPKVYRSSEHVRRHFCADCGTGLFYFNASMPGIVDIQSATYDDPEAVPVTMQIQVAERLRWMKRAHELPAFDRFPPQP
ncbi:MULTISPECIES: GFA family protein [Bradyrhizobium]|uniref:GFA family protein n=1 Tax=Bradyrhizobium vignae TaxID=1549949 RepID=A0ABS3ZQB2_9BRAD|nr:GFA family protein [Bradyrhizobium vignae]MBP0109918.1 GFA family protein [Bradyrhizobium vignae]